MIDIVEFSPEIEEGDFIPYVGGALRGYFDVVCRNEDGSVDWEVHKPNLLTDYGRRMFGVDFLAQCGIFTSPCAEAPNPLRYTLSENSGHAQWQGLASPSTDWNSITKNWSVTFGTPGFSRQVASVGLVASSGYTTVMSYGITAIVCYSIISPVKIQQASQTLEMSYRLTLQVGV